MTRSSNVVFRITTGVATSKGSFCVYIISPKLIIYALTLNLSSPLTIFSNHGRDSSWSLYFMSPWITTANFKSVFDLSSGKKNLHGRGQGKHLTNPASTIYLFNASKYVTSIGRMPKLNANCGLHLEACV